MSSTALRVVRWGATVLAAACALAPATASADRYSVVNGCYALRAPDGTYVRQDALGYLTGASSPATATGFRMQATALGRYLLYGRDRTMPAALGPTAVVNFREPGPAGDWELQPSGDGFVLVNQQTKGRLAVGLLRRLIQGAATTWRLAPTTACATFPEIQTNATGTVPKGARSDAPVRGFIDDHIHLGAFDFLGGRFHCGRPWSPRTA